MSHDVRKQQTLDRLQRRIDELPMLPQSVVALLSLDFQADDYFEHVISVIRHSSVFSTKLLHYANAIAIEQARPIITLERALVVISCRSAVNLLTSHALMQIFAPRRDWEYDLWRHALDVACLMQVLAPHAVVRAMDPEQAFLFGLLHDVGRFALYLEAPENLRIIDETKWDSFEFLIQAEQLTAGISHSELGYLAIRHWQLSENIAAAVRYHHAPQAAVAEVPEEDLALIWLLRDVDWIAVKLALRGDYWRTLSKRELDTLLAPTRFHTLLNLKVETLIELVRSALQRSETLQIAMELLPSEQEERG